MADQRELARAALAEITPDASVGEFLGTRDEAEHIVSYLWASAKPGYPDWRWTVTVVHLPDAAPSVMELELLPTEASVLAPEWVPWAVRLAEFREAQAALAASAEDDGAALDAVEFVDSALDEGDDQLSEDDDDLDDDDLDDDDLDGDDEDEDEDDDDEDDDDDDDEDDDFDDEAADDVESDEFVEEEDLDEFGAADDDDLHGITLPGEEDVEDTSAE